MSVIFFSSQSAILRFHAYVNVERTDRTRKGIAMKKALVTGGFGFIGFHLVDRLLTEGIEVIALDQMPDERKAIQEEMKMRVGRNALLTIVAEKIERCDLPALTRGVDVVFHLAGSTSEDSDWQTFENVIENNVNVTRMLIEALEKGTRLVYPSTVEVYGGRTGEVKETTPTNPTTPYGITKLASENLIKRLCPKRGIPYVILRLPTVYGPFQRETMTYQQVLTGIERPTIDRSTVDVLYVDDVVDAFLLAATTKSINEIYQLSSNNKGEWFTGMKLLEKNDCINEKETMFLSGEKAERVLQFRAKTPLEEGLKKQKEHIQSLEKRSGWLP